MLTAAFALAVLGALCLTVLVVTATDREQEVLTTAAPAPRVRIEQVFSQRAGHAAPVGHHAVEAALIPMQTRSDRVQQHYRPYDEASRHSILLEL